ncbi:hypothetical protein HL653_17195 [Sphingomonas sp. AP4-R1]|uniref:hypothetical protein n=1 Tax=Sphingomonas sp. AP4-R1 TaxID=2735134 RepID=UPI0014938C76|nr:hypothetical protein [Sphingomonas sp. AP4-R1]QJU59269.1 hypothetical protein HL653_17195 [Sphingomonas sp. AP4-R1]
MSSCLILGDSIALGIAAAITILWPSGCDVRARVGATTSDISALVPAKHYDLVIVSAGSNDATGPAFDRDIVRLRQRLRAGQISWIYPRSRPRAWSVYRAASRHGDRTIDLAALASRDGVHPADYPAAARVVLTRAFRSGGEVPQSG